MKAMKTYEDLLSNCNESTHNPDATVDLEIRDNIQHLIDEQPYAVLCVQGEGHPYGALVAFAFSEDLRQAVFVTPVATRKYRLLNECHHVAIVIDNRPNNTDELMEIETVTVTGCSKMIERGDELDRWSRLLVTRHPNLSSYVNADTYALFRVLGEFLFKQQSASEKVRCSVISRNSC